jgi:glycerol-3-phosphate dehydrogenase
LPGGDIDGGDLEGFMADAEAKYHFLEPALLKRYVMAYGTRMDTMLDGVRSQAGLGAELCPGLYECEALYLVHHEWACTAEDILWRRTKLGLKAASDNVASLERWVDRRAA